MPVQPPDFEKYAQTLQQTMAAAIQEAESLAALVAAGREAAADVRITIQEKLNALESLARENAAKYVAEHRQQLRTAIRENLVNSIAVKLGHSGESVEYIAELLDVPEELVQSMIKD